MRYSASDSGQSSEDTAHGQGGDEIDQEESEERRRCGFQSGEEVKDDVEGYGDHKFDRYVCHNARQCFCPYAILDLVSNCHTELQHLKALLNLQG